MILTITSISILYYILNMLFFFKLSDIIDKLDDKGLGVGDAILCAIFLPMTLLVALFVGILIMVEKMRDSRVKKLLNKRIF